MDRSNFSIQGQSCYVDYQGHANGLSNYIVGTLNSPESPVGVTLKGTDCHYLRLEAVKEGLIKIIAGGTHY